MPVPTTPVPAADELDDLFSYDVPTDDVFRDFQPTMDNAPTRARSPAKIADLGIDEEIQVVKKRKPIAKLDENRLLSQAGIPKLRRITKERLKLKGKGHEYTDIARLLTLYQLWLDDLYPRAKFADGLAMIEKLGHTKRMQTMRREWIREGKPESKADSPRPAPARSTHASLDPVRETSTAAATATRAAEPTAAHASTDESLFLSDHEADDQPPDDDLDALLAEDARTGTALMTATPISRRDEFEDEMEAMADLW